MKKFFPFLPLFFLAFVPVALNALTNEERHGREEINQLWVDRHNDKLSPVVKEAVKKFKAPKHSHMISSLRKSVIPMKRLKLSIAEKHGIPLSKPHPEKVTVPLAALYVGKAQDQSFLIADYADDLDPLHASSNIYWKVGLIYRPLFEGKGYRGCARVITLGKDSPLFFEIATYGGGVRCDKILYTFIPEKLRVIKDDLFDHPETVDVSTYIQEVLEFNVWLKGATLYKDVDKDGLQEVINSTEVMCPDELKSMLKKKYNLVENDFAGAFRQAVTFYKWDNTKLKFENLGVFFY
ncbi:MAG TPA: hypothetical protein VIK48_00060 [Candidatus Manganitrophaceae bacterium]